jgi:hypothetical protein
MKKGKKTSLVLLFCTSNDYFDDRHAGRGAAATEVLALGGAVENGPGPSVLDFLVRGGTRGAAPAGARLVRGRSGITTGGFLKSLGVITRRHSAGGGGRSDGMRRSFSTALEWSAPRWRLTICIFSSSSFLVAAQLISTALTSGIRRFNRVGTACFGVRCCTAKDDRRLDRADALPLEGAFHRALFIRALVWRLPGVYRPLPPGVAGEPRVYCWLHVFRRLRFFKTSAMDCLRGAPSSVVRTGVTMPLEGDCNCGWAFVELLRRCGDPFFAGL